MFVLIALFVLLADIPTSAPSAVPSPPAPAATTSPRPVERPRYAYLPDDENWKPLCDPANRIDPFDSLKCIPLGADPNDYLTLGFDERLKYEHFFNKDWNASNSGYLLERELLDVDVHAARLRAFVQLEHATATDQHAPIDPTWQDDFASTSAYLAYAVGGATGSSKPPLSIMVGRQLLAYGSERMIDDRSGLNTEQPFDGVRLRFIGGTWRTDVFVTRPVVVNPSAFDDLADTTKSFSGIYGSDRMGPNTFEVYGLVDQRQSQFYYRGVAPEVRETLGVRYATTGKSFDSDTEVDEQFGSFGGATIDAYALETNLGFDFGRGRNHFRVGLGGGIASGDKNPKSSHFTLFRAPYPTGLTFGIIEANGNENTAGFTPNASYTYANKVTVSVKDYFYYRQSLADGVYSAPGFPLRAPAGSDASPIGNLGYVSLSDVLGRHLTVFGAYARYLVGQFLEQSPQATGLPSQSTAYYNLWFDVKI
jgi:hypothetical protein